LDKEGYTLAWERRNGVLIIMDNHQRIYVADVKTGVTQEIKDCPRGHGLAVEILFLRDGLASLVSFSARPSSYLRFSLSIFHDLVASWMEGDEPYTH
jgi:hypothetical protein